MQRQKKVHSGSKKVTYAMLAILLLGVIGALSLHFINSNKVSNKIGDSSAKTTSTVKSAQTDFTSNDTTKKDSSASAKDNVSGGITDTNGAATTNSSSSSASSNSDIAVNSPTKNALLSNGDTVSGTSKLAKVSYRIVDNQVGMISTGSLNVVNGKFSGNIQFQTNAQNGQLDFFGTQSDGNEFDNVVIPVNFK